MLPLISIIIPVYNRQKELMLSLKSIQKQTYRPLEVIIVDDGSTQKVKSEESTIQNILGEISFTLIEQKNSGAPAARNNGFRHSKGEFVLFWDADIIGVPEMIEKMYQELLSHPEASYCYSNYTHINKKIRSRVFDAAALQKINYITTMSLLRREDFLGFDESLQRFQDWDLWLTLLEQGKQGTWIDEYLYASVATTNGISFWMPSFAYKAPWKYFPILRKKVQAYENAKKIIFTKHSL